MHKSKDLTRKVRLYIVAMHNKDIIKKFSALMQSVSLTSDTSASKYIPRKYITQCLGIFWKNHTNKNCFEENNVVASSYKD